MNTATLDGWAEAVDRYGRAGWIALMVLGFIAFWPIGLAILAYLIWSGRMGCKGYGNRAWSERRWARSHHKSSSSGNIAFDEYRDETLRRLEDEQSEFSSFLDSLRHAKDKAEFDQFMAKRDDRDPSTDSDLPQTS